MQELGLQFWDRDCANNSCRKETTHVYTKIAAVFLSVIVMPD